MKEELVNTIKGHEILAKRASLTYKGTDIDAALEGIDTRLTEMTDAEVTDLLNSLSAP